MFEPAATTKTTATGIYCKTCGYDLRASKEAGRCPECGRVFSPDDSKTFRPRPFAAPWKRALGRWAKRGAVLLLGLVILLAGLWGWLYWDWKEEEATLAQVGAKTTSFPPRPLGGECGLWIARRLGRRADFLLRAEFAELPPTATDVDLIPLQKLHYLRQLDISGTQVTDAGLGLLQRLPNLRGLSLARVNITDAGLARLRDLRGLESLRLVGTQVTNDGLRHLAELPKLRHLVLIRMPLDETGLMSLGGLTAILELDLSGTPINDTGLMHLRRLTTLRYLYLYRTPVTAVGVAKLKAALPGCRIEGP